jgi:hypothetical protein
VPELKNAACRKSVDEQFNLLRERWITCGVASHKHLFDLRSPSADMPVLCVGVGERSDARECLVGKCCRHRGQPADRGVVMPNINAAFHETKQVAKQPLMGLRQEFEQPPEPMQFFLTVCASRSPDAFVPYVPKAHPMSFRRYVRVVRDGPKAGPMKGAPNVAWGTRKKLSEDVRLKRQRSGKIEHREVPREPARQFVVFAGLGGVEERDGTFVLREERFEDLCIGATPEDVPRPCRGPELIISRK